MSAQRSVAAAPRGLFLAAVGAGEGASRARQLVAMSALFAVLTGCLALASGGFWLINLTAAYAVMLALVGSNLLFGQLGLVSLAQYALFGIGGWTMLRLSHAFHLPFEIGLIASAFAAAVVGVLWGLPALRFRGIHLALITLMLAGAFQSLINAFNFPGGGAGFFGNEGLEGQPRVLIARPYLAQSDQAYFFYVAAVALIGLIVVELHRRAKPGRAWALIRKDPRVATATGVRVELYQAWAFALAGWLAGAGGALLAGLYGQLDAAGFSAMESITLFAASIISGTTNWVGVVIGGLLIRAIPTALTELGAASSVSLIVFGLGLAGPVLGPPNGFAGMIDSLADRLSARNRRP